MTPAHAARLLRSVRRLVFRANPTIAARAAEMIPAAKRLALANELPPSAQDRARADEAYQQDYFHHL